MSEEPATRRAEAGLALPVASAGISSSRKTVGAALLLLGFPALTGLLLPHRDDLSYATPVLLVLMLVVTVAMVGGMWVALPAALAGALSLNWFFTPPYNTLAVRHADQLVVLGVYLAVALAVSGVVDLAARRTAEAARARAEAHALSTLAGAALGAEQTLPDLLRRVQQTFGMREVALLESIGQEWTTVATTGAAELADGDIELRVAAGPGLQLAVRGPALFATDRRVLTAFADATATALEGWRLAERARAAAQLEAADRMRTALLAAVGHDLRTPLAAAKAAVSSLRQQDVDWQPAEREALLETIEESTDRLQALVANLLDASRLQVGLVSARAAAVGLAEVLDVVMLKLPPADRDRVHLDIADGLPDARADAGLLERVLANILDNALRHAPVGSMVTVSAQTRDGFLQCDVVDHGPGVAANDRARVFAPFQRLDDRGGSGIGLGLAVARGFTEAMGGTIAPRTTPGGGLTMRVCLPLADATPIDSLRTP